VDRTFSFMEWRSGMCIGFWWEDDIKTNLGQIG
jgi:hypothetical protein